MTARGGRPALDGQMRRAAEAPFYRSMVVDYSAARRDGVIRSLAPLRLIR
jgi:hypothetical protein